MRGLSCFSAQRAFEAGGKVYRTRFFGVARDCIESSADAAPLPAAALATASGAGLPLELVGCLVSAANVWVVRAMLLNNRRCWVRMAFSLDGHAITQRNSRAMHFALGRVQVEAEIHGI